MTTPQQALDSLFQIENEMAGLATNAALSGQRARQDALARLAVASEGTEHLIDVVLAAPPEQVPYREVLLEVRAAIQRRTRGIQEVILRHKGAPGQAAMQTACWLVELPEPHLQVYHERLQGLFFADQIAKSILWMVGRIG